MEYIKKGTKLKEELSQLEILKALERNPNFKQRDISKVTGINLFKVNFLIKRMLEKWYLKCKNVYKNPNKLSYLYWLTPEGFSRKSKLIYKFVKVTLDNYDTYVNMLINNLQIIEKSRHSKILLYGSNNVIQIFEKISEAFEVDITGVINLDIINLNDAQYCKNFKLELNNNYDIIVILSNNSENQLDDIMDQFNLSKGKLYFLE